MRVLVVSNLYPPAAVGGYERMCRGVVERFRRRGHEVRVLTSTFGGPVADGDPDVQRGLQPTPSCVRASSPAAYRPRRA